MNPIEARSRAGLLRRLDAFRRDREDLLEELALLEPAWLTARPLAGKWSILEIVEHLVLAERSVFAHATEPSKLVPHERRPRHHFRRFAVRWTLRLKIPVSVPAREMEPHGETSLAELRRLWEMDLAALLSCAEKLAEHLLRAPIFVHLVGGPLSFEEALDFGQIHFEGHLHQIRERLAAQAATDSRSSSR